MCKNYKEKKIIYINFGKRKIRKERNDKDIYDDSYYQLHYEIIDDVDKVNGYYI